MLQLLKELEADAGAVELEESAVFAGRISYGGSGGWIEGQQAQRDILDQQPEAAGPGWDSEPDADEVGRLCMLCTILNSRSQLQSLLVRILVSNRLCFAPCKWLT